MLSYLVHTSAELLSKYTQWLCIITFDMPLDRMKSQIDTLASCETPRQQVHIHCSFVGCEDTNWSAFWLRKTFFVKHESVKQLIQHALFEQQFEVQHISI